MSEGRFLVDDVKIGERDLTECEILKIFTKVRPQYAVYRTRDRVSVQFSDDENVASQQRKDMSTLNLTRAQITGLIDGWSRSRWELFKAKAKKFEGRTATALVLSLEGDSGAALASLNDTKADIIAERSSWGRFEYLISASLLALLAIIVFTFVQRKIYPFTTPSGNIWLAARAGTVGAFFSIALAIRNRTVLTNLYRRDNFADATLRIVIGMIAAGVLILLLGSKLVPNFKIGDANISGTDITWQTVLVIGFVAGFLERLVPDLLEKGAARDDAAKAAADKAAADKAAANKGTTDNPSQR
ncbi:MAG: hypothetical protein QOG74_2690 [Alphaproteobacteria bacterium]|nr:hypothetical protein [Alphaproteobacteria bacterium]